MTDHHAPYQQRIDALPADTPACKVEGGLSIAILHVRHLWIIAQ